MLNLFRPIVLTAMTAMFWNQPAWAQAAADIASRAGLLGHWRLHCDQPIGVDNEDIFYTVRNGQLYIDRDFGERRQDSSMITSVSKRPDGTLDMVIAFASLSQTREQIDLITEGRTKRAIFNRNLATDEYSIRDGKYTATGGSVPAMTKCY